VPGRRDISGDDAGGVPNGGSDARVAIAIIAGIVVMFLVGFLLLVFAMASDWA
jgi:hypothetical protein